MAGLISRHDLSYRIHQIQQLLGVWGQVISDSRNSEDWRNQVTKPVAGTSVPFVSKEVTKELSGLSATLLPEFIISPVSEEHSVKPVASDCYLKEASIDSLQKIARLKWLQEKINQDASALFWLLWFKIENFRFHWAVTCSQSEQWKWNMATYCWLKNRLGALHAFHSFR